MKHKITVTIFLVSRFNYEPEGNNPKYFNCRKRRAINPEAFTSKDKIETFSNEGKLRKWSPRRPILIMSKGSSINRIKIIKEGVLKQQEGIKNTISKNTDKYKTSIIFGENIYVI